MGWIRFCIDLDKLCRGYIEVVKWSVVGGQLFYHGTVHKTT